MDLTTCKLYGKNRKRDIFRLLRIKDKKELKNIVNKYTPFISKNGNKKRIIERINEATPKLLKVQKTICTYLQDIKFEDNVFSGIKGRSYIQNGEYHLNSNYFVALDISKFFPNTHREKIYNFWRHDMKTSQDVAEILTNLSSINLDAIKYVKKEIFSYIDEKGIKTNNHLPTGSPLSSIMSYLVNYHMFDKINDICNKNNYKVTFYIDDIVISSKSKINMTVIKKIMDILRYHGYKITKEKLKYYNKNEFKRVTGNIISKDGKTLVIPNKVKYKLKRLLKNKSIPREQKKSKVLGYINILRQSKITRYQNLEKSYKNCI